MNDLESIVESFLNGLDNIEEMYQNAAEDKEQFIESLKSMASLIHDTLDALSDDKQEED